ncbi:MAG: AAA family ATPase [Micropruina sp.]
MLHHIAGKRLDRGLLTVVDATNVSREARASLVQLARDHGVLPVAIVLDVPPRSRSAQRGPRRPDVRDGPIKAASVPAARSLRGLARRASGRCTCSRRSTRSSRRSSSGSGC